VFFAKLCVSDAVDLGSAATWLLTCLPADLGAVRQFRKRVVAAAFRSPDWRSGWDRLSAVSTLAWLQTKDLLTPRSDMCVAPPSWLQDLLAEEWQPPKRRHRSCAVRSASREPIDKLCAVDVESDVSDESSVEVLCAVAAMSDKLQESCAEVLCNAAVFDESEESFVGDSAVAVEYVESEDSSTEELWVIESGESSVEDIW